METTAKIKNGTIRIENGRLVGLGVGENESIDIEALHNLFDFLGKFGVIESISDTISAIGELQAEASVFDSSDNDELKMFINEELRLILRSVDTFKLNLILKTFNK